MALWQWVGMFGSIILLDLVLSGDNALVLGAAVSQLPRRQRMYALIIGGGGAILLRIILTSIASVIFNIPWIQTIGAIILFGIALRLLAGRGQPPASEEASDPAKKLHKGQGSFKSAALTIFIADITMSLDNVLAVGAAANGAFFPMAVGLLISIMIILCGSALIAELMTRFTWLLGAAALVLAWTSGTMIRDDLCTTFIFKRQLCIWSPYIIPIVSSICMVCILLYFYLHDRAQPLPATAKVSSARQKRPVKQRR